MTIWRLRIACWIPKATNTHCNCAIIIAFPTQQRLQERASLLRYTYTACLFCLWTTDAWFVILKCSMLQEYRALNKPQTVSDVSCYHVQRVNM